MPPDRKSTRLNSSHTEIYTLSLHDALPISKLHWPFCCNDQAARFGARSIRSASALSETTLSDASRSEEHTSELQSHRDLHSFPTRRSSDLETALAFLL